MARSHFSLGRAYAMKGLHRQSLRNYIESLRISEETGNQKAIGINYIYIGQLHYQLFKVSKSPEGLNDALHYYQQGLHIFKKLNLKVEELGTYTQIGFLFQNQGRMNLDSAEFYLMKALQGYRELRDIDSEIMMLLNLANVTLSKKDYKKAESKLLEVVSLSNGTNRPFILPIAYDNPGVVSLHLKDYEKAIDYHNKSIDLSRTNPEALNNLPNTYNNLAGLYTTKRQFKEAIDYHKLALLASEKKNDSGQMLNAYAGL